MSKSLGYIYEAPNYPPHANGFFLYAYPLKREAFDKGVNPKSRLSSSLPILPLFFLMGHDKRKP